MSSDVVLPVWTSDVAQEVKIRMGSTGQAAVPATTVMQDFDSICCRLGERPAIYQKRPSDNGTVAVDTPWTQWTWNEYRASVDLFGKSLIALGCERFDVVNIIGFNAPEWFFANFGAIAAGCVAAGIYATNSPSACQYVSAHSKAKVVVCDGMKQLEKFYIISKDLPYLKALVVYGISTIPEDAATKCAVPIYTFESFLDLGKEIGNEVIAERSNSWRPGETCTLIYTSGTTGPPKAVMITNDNITWTTRTLILAGRKPVDENEIMISYLPLSHIAAQVLDMHVPLQTGMQIYFAQPDALKVSLARTLKEVRPTILFGIPRVWEKIYEKLEQVGKASSGIQKILSMWAKYEAGSYWEACEYNAMKKFSVTRTIPLTYYLARVLLHAVHKKLGLDRCHSFYVAAAPIEIKILKYFASIDIPIMELFGQSECTGPHAINRYDAFIFGSVGRPLLGTESKYDDATGELCYRGRHICAGYMNMNEQTMEAIDSEGWLHSGDVVKIDDNHDPLIPPPSGFFYITGRIKELIITAGGENIPPVLIEDQLKIAMPALSRAMVIGDKRKFLTVLLCLRVEVDGHGLPTNKLTGVALETSKAIGSTALTTDEARADPKWQTYLDDGVKKANEQAASQAQKIGKWTLLSTDFSEVGGELTPTLKLKRSVAVSIHAQTIESMYA